VVTNMRMITTTLPNNISLGDDYTLYVSLTQDGKVIEKKEFLHFVKVTLTQQSDKDRWDWMLLDNGRGADEFAGDGKYAIHLDETLREGEHVLTVDVDGTTFKRTHRQVINVYDSPVLATITPERDAATQGFTLLVTPRAGMIDPGSLNVTAVITDKEENKNTFTVPKINDNEWRLALDDYSRDQRYSAEIEVNGEKPNGKPVDAHIGPLYFGAEIKPAEKVVAQKPSENVLPHDNTVNEQETAMTEMDTPINWLFVFMQVIVFNLLFAAGLFFGIKAWRKTMNLVSTPWDDLVHE